MHVRNVLALAASLQTIAGAAVVSTFAGPAYERPRQPSRDLQGIVDRLESNLAQALESGCTAYGQFEPGLSSVSIQGRSIFEQKPILDFSFTSDSSSRNVDVSSNSIFRIGSISKVFTVYALLVEAGFEYLNDLVIDHVSELKEWSKNRADSPQRADWKEITIGSLASQLAGIARDYNLADLSDTSFDFVAEGLPPLDASEIPHCGITTPCSRQEFFNGFTKSPPSFPVYQTPAYSNTAFRILAYAISSIVGRPYKEILQESVLRPLGLNSTTLSNPHNTTQDVVLSNDDSDSFYLNMGDESPTGGMFSSTRDLVTFGNAILRSQQLNAVTTHRWLKPQSHTASLDLSIGMPWEIRRSTLSTGRTTDLYTKSGSIGVYTSELILFPDYGISLAVLAAGPDGSMINHLSNILIDTLLPALEDSAKATTKSTYGGAYSALDGLNSSISFTTDDKPGLVVQRWISNGSDVFRTASMFAAATNGGFLESIRLFPTGLENGTETVYRAVFETTGNGQVVGLFRSKVGAWASVDELVYGRAPIDEFVFYAEKKSGQFDTAKIRAVWNAGMRSYMERLDQN